MAVSAFEGKVFLFAAAIYRDAWALRNEKTTERMKRIFGPAKRTYSFERAELVRSVSQLNQM